MSMKSNFYLGCHLSSSKGYLAMVKEAIDLDCSTFQFFTRNPRGGSQKPFDKEDVTKANDLLNEYDFGYVVAHAPYTMNPATDDINKKEFVLKVMEEDLSLLEYFSKAYYNFHPGFYLSLSLDEGIDNIVSVLNTVLKKDQKTMVLLETMAGKGTEIGRNFEEIAKIISKVDLKDKVGVCLDTCHVYDGGYDIVNQIDEVLSEFDRIISLDKLKAIHLNNSLYGFASHKDRHEKILNGKIPFSNIVKIINHPLLKDLPFILETPNDNEGYREEIKLLRGNRD